MSDVKLPKTIIIGFHRPNMKTCIGGFQEQSGLEPEATCSTNMVHTLLQTNIHLQSSNFPFHYATRSSLVKSDGSGQDAEESEPFTQVVCILFCNNDD